MTTIDKRILWLAGIVAAGMIFGCGKSSPSAAKPEPPAKVENAVKEADLTTVRLSEKAEARLGIATHAVEMKSLPGTLVAGGEVVAVPGQAGPRRRARGRDRSCSGGRGGLPFGTHP